MVQIMFSVHDARCNSGYRIVSHIEPSLELCKDYMHKYHNRCTGWFHWIEDGKAYGAYDKIGVQL